MILEAVEKRFGTTITPHAIQWLSDNGSPYRAHDTIVFAVHLGLIPCFTPVRSPQSDGVAEAFVKNFKRDDVYVIARMLKPSCPNCRPGITTRFILTKPCA